MRENADWQVLCEYDGSNAFKARYVYGNYIDEVLLMNDGSNDYYFAHDHLYSPVALMDDSGSVVERYEYDAYGDCNVMNASYVSRTASLYGNTVAFTGRTLDILDNGNLKLMYYRNRYYSPFMGRMLTPDPLGITPNASEENPFEILGQYTDGMNLYEYAFCRPSSVFDPFGLKGIPVEAMISILKGAYYGKVAIDEIKKIKGDINDIRIILETDDGNEAKAAYERLVEKNSKYVIKQALKAVAKRAGASSGAGIIASVILKSGELGNSLGNHFANTAEDIGCYCLCILCTEKANDIPNNGFLEVNDGHKSGVCAKDKRMIVYALCKRKKDRSFIGGIGEGIGLLPREIYYSPQKCQ